MALLKHVKVLPVHKCVARDYHKTYKRNPWAKKCPPSHNSKNQHPQYLTCLYGSVCLRRFYLKKKLATQNLQNLNHN